MLSSSIDPEKPQSNRDRVFNLAFQEISSKSNANETGSKSIRISAHNSSIAEESTFIKGSKAAFTIGGNSVSTTISPSYGYNKKQADNSAQVSVHNSMIFDKADRGRLNFINLELSQMTDDNSNILDNTLN